MTSELHPDIAHLGFLLGTWRGRGEGSYPTIESFAYVEELTFQHVGKPFLSLSQKTKHADTGVPLHAEVGYLRPVGTERVELVVVSPTGIFELHEGTISSTGSTGSTGSTADAVRLALSSTQVSTTPTAKAATEVVRTFDVAGDQLSYVIDMAAVDQPLQHHLAATLNRDAG